MFKLPSVTNSTSFHFKLLSTLSLSLVGGPVYTSSIRFKGSDKDLPSTNYYIYRKIHLKQTRLARNTILTREIRLQYISMHGELTNSLRLNSESINRNPMPDVQGEGSKKIETEGGHSWYRGLPSMK